MSTVKRYFAAVKEATKNLFSKPGTVMFPNEHVPLPEDFRGSPTLTPENCTLCLRCIRICPTLSISIAEIDQDNTQESINVMFSDDQDIYYFTVDLGRCCYCKACENTCPFDAIHLKPDWLTANMSRDELKQKSIVIKAHKVKKKKNQRRKK